MPTGYPTSIDSFINPSPLDDLDSASVPHDVQHANANDAIHAIEDELGTDPSGAYATVAARIAAVEAAAALAAAPANFLYAALFA